MSRMRLNKGSHFVEFRKYSLQNTDKVEHRTTKIRTLSLEILHRKYLTEVYAEYGYKNGHIEIKRGINY